MRPAVSRARSVLYAIVVACGVATPAMAAGAGSALVRWQPSPGPGVAGYHIYRRSITGTYGAPENAGLPAPGADGTLSYATTVLDATATYAFAVAAYRGDGVESALSNEIVLVPAVEPEDGGHVLGTRDVGANSAPVTADRKRVSPFALAEPGTLSSLWMYLSNPTLTTQVMRGVVYDDAGGAPGTLVAAGVEVTIPGGMPARWVALPLAAPLVLRPGTYWLGNIAGDASAACRYFFGNLPGARFHNADAYADGPAPAFGASTVEIGPIAVFATYEPGILTSDTPPDQYFGSGAPGVSGIPLTADRKRVSPFWLTEPARVTRLWMYLANPGTAPQAVQAVVYADDVRGQGGALLARGEEVVLPPGTPPAWIALPLETPLSLQPGRYWLGNLS